MGQFDASPFGNDTALDFLDELREATMPAELCAVVNRILEEWEGYVLRHQAGLVPRIESLGEFEEGLRIFLEAGRTSNPHVRREVLEKMLQEQETFIRGQGPSLIELGGDEALAVVAAAATMRAILENDFELMPVRYRGIVKKATREGLDPPRCLKALREIRSTPHVLDQFDSRFVATIERVERELSKSARQTRTGTN